MQETISQWWGEFSFETGTTAQWEIGPIRILVQRLQREWLVVHEQIERPASRQEFSFAFKNMNLKELDLAQMSRFVCRHTTEQLTVLPALADRSIVSRPFTPFTVPAEEKATIYVSTPFWFTLSSGSPLKKIFEVPMQRPSDTWFGSNTQEGETCYSSRTYGRINLENLEIYPYRAFTQVHIHNNGDSPLLVERLNLPVPFLSIFHSPQSGFWTETVTVVQTQGTSLAEFNIEKEQPVPAAGAQLVAPPRQYAHKGMLIRAFSVLTLQGTD